MVDGPDTLQVGLAPGCLGRLVVRVDRDVVGEELPLLGRSGLRRLDRTSPSPPALREGYRDTDSTESQNPFDHDKIPPNWASTRPRSYYLLAHVHANSARGPARAGFCMHFL